MKALLIRNFVDLILTTKELYVYYTYNSMKNDFKCFSSTYV